MAEVKRYGAAKRFGARYGRRLKQKYAEVEALHKQKYSCPYCSYKQAKRLASGIWQCKKCSSKFTSRAYQVSKKIVIQGPVEGFDIETTQEVQEQEEPQEEEIEVQELPKKKSKKQKAPQEEEEEEQGEE